MSAEAAWICYALRRGPTLGLRALFATPFAITFKFKRSLTNITTYNAQNFTYGHETRLQPPRRGSVAREVKRVREPSEDCGARGSATGAGPRRGRPPPAEP
ncbi:unnamed protein product [Leptosia nina]|uniref:Secreted protein n=1 Tax=Leptosia nina TaxID=320188 RepID=A0AAV1JN10_9NEOP